MCRGTYVDACTRAAQVLLGELCPLSGYHLLWPYYVLVCVGIKGGWWVLRGRWRFRITRPQIDVPLKPSALFWVLLYVRQRTVGWRETDNVHTCGHDGRINASVMPGSDFYCAVGDKSLETNFKRKKKRVAAVFLPTLLETERSDAGGGEKSQRRC